MLKKLLYVIRLYSKENIPMGKFILRNMQFTLCNKKNKIRGA